MCIYIYIYIYIYNVCVYIYIYICSSEGSKGGVLTKGGLAIYRFSRLKARLTTHHQDLPMCTTMEHCLISDPPFTNPRPLDPPV